MRSMPRFCVSLAVPFCALLLTTAISSAGVVIRVPLDQPTIADGLGAAASGDTVLVDCDTYYESGLSLPSGVTLMSASYDSGCVVIDGGASGTSILSCMSITGAVVSGITFTNGSAPGGGALDCNTASALFDYCFFSDNHATTTGGAVYWAYGTPEFVGCTFNGNTAATAGAGIALFGTAGNIIGCRFASNETQWGAGAYAFGLDTTTAFTECEFQWNVATSTGRGGGAVWCDSQAGPSFFHCRFDQNEGYYGGAVANYTKATSVYTECEFNENTSHYAGGAVLGHDDYAVFSTCEFTFNEVTSGDGGAMSFELSDASMEHCVFYANEGNRAAAIDCMMESAITLTSCTIVENVAEFGVGGIHVHDDSDAAIDQTIIAFNRGGAAVECGFGGTATVTCSDISDNDGGDWIDCIAGQEATPGNLNTNPLLCDVPSYFLYLCADSPCLPANNDCGELIGAYGEGCAACESAVEQQSWGAIKSIYR